MALGGVPLGSHDFNRIHSNQFLKKAPKELNAFMFRPFFSKASFFGFHISPGGVYTGFALCPLLWDFKHQIPEMMVINLYFLLFRVTKKANPVLDSFFPICFCFRGGCVFS